jgi:hypothetical protein
MGGGESSEAFVQCGGGGGMLGRIPDELVIVEGCI